MLKLKFVWNLATVNVTNSPIEPIIFDTKNAGSFRFEIDRIL